MRNLNAEIELKREQESLMGVRSRLFSLSDEEFRQYWIRVGQYFSSYTAYTSHLTSDELHQFHLLGPVKTLSKSLAKDVVYPSAGQSSSGNAARLVPNTSVNKSLGEPIIAK